MLCFTNLCSRVFFSLAHMTSRVVGLFAASLTNNWNEPTTRQNYQAHEDTDGRTAVEAAAPHRWRWRKWQRSDVTPNSCCLNAHVHLYARVCLYICTALKLLVMLTMYIVCCYLVGCNGCACTSALCGWVVTVLLLCLILSLLLTCTIVI